MSEVQAAPAGGLPADRRGEDKRTAAQRVRDAARELFYRQGIHATGVDEVCKAAGTTKMSLYRAYPSKDALVESILRDTCAAAEAFHAELQRTDLPARERPMAFVRGAIAALLSPGFRGCPLGQAVVEFPDPDHPIRQVADARKRKGRAFMRDLCAQAGAADPEALGDSLQLMIEGAFAVAPSIGCEAAAESLERSAAALLRVSLPQG